MIMIMTIHSKCYSESAAAEVRWWGAGAAAGWQEVKNKHPYSNALWYHNLT